MFNIDIMGQRVGFCAVLCAISNILKNNGLSDNNVLFVTASKKNTKGCILHCLIEYHGISIDRRVCLSISTASAVKLCS